MSWESLEPWVVHEGKHKLRGEDKNGRHDMAAHVQYVKGQWEVRTWPQAAVGYDFADIVMIDGTLEEAKAVAYAKVKM